MTDSRHLIHLMGSEEPAQAVLVGEEGMKAWCSWGEVRWHLKGRNRVKLRLKGDVTQQRVIVQGENMREWCS